MFVRTVGSSFMVTRFQSFLGPMFKRKLKVKEKSKDNEKESDASSMTSMKSSVPSTSDPVPFDVERLTDRELHDLTLKTLENMNIKDPETALKSFDRAKMIRFFNQQASAPMKPSQTPSHYIFEMKKALLVKDAPPKGLLNSLMISLGSQAIPWVEEFERGDGFTLLMNILGQLLKHMGRETECQVAHMDDQLVSLHYIVKILRSILNTWPGAEYFISPGSVLCSKLIEALCILNAVRSLPSAHYQSVENILTLLASISLLQDEKFESNGFELLHRDLFDVAERRNVPKFLFLVDCFKYEDPAITYKALRLINTMLSMIDDSDLPTRLIWRNELMSTGLKAHLPKIEKEAKQDSNIRIHYTRFQENRKADSDDFANKMGRVGGADELCSLPSVPPFSRSASPPEVVPPTLSSSAPPAAPPPPPPNLLGKGSKSTGGPPPSAPPPPPPPPPNLLGKGLGPPPPPAPPPPGLGSQVVAEVPTFLKSNSKAIPPANVPMKKLPWKSILPASINEESIWAKLVNSTSIPADFFNSLANRFSISQPRESLHPSASIVQAKVKKPVVIQDAKTLQALAILQGSCKLSHKEWRRAILHMDESVLASGLIGQLRAVLPTVDVLRQLKQAAEKEFENMVEGEQFVSILASIDGLPIRLESIELKMNWTDTMNELRSSISAIAAACEEVKGSEGFKCVLSLVLLAGNYMGGANGPKEVYAFELGILTKLGDIKDKNGDGTLMHTMVEMVEKKHGRADFLVQDFRHVERASRLDLQELSRSRDSAKATLKKVSSHVSAYNKQGDQDRFLEKMQPFVEKAEKELSTIDTAWNGMQTKWTLLQSYLSFDPKKYPMSSLFSDLRTFMDHYECARKELEARNMPTPKRHPFKQLQPGTGQAKGPRVTENHGIMDQIERFLENNGGGSNARTNRDKPHSRKPTDENRHWNAQRERTNKDNPPSADELEKLLRGL